MNSIIIALTFLLISVLNAEAQDQRLAVIRKIEGIELISENLARQLEKTALQVTLQQSGLEVLLAGQNAPTQTNLDAVAIEGEVGKTRNGYRLETRLVDLKSKKLIGKAGLDGIREEDLIRMYESAVRRIFEPFEKEAKERKAREPQERNPPPVIKPPAPQPSTTQVNTPDAKTLDFRKRVQDLKSGVDDQIDKALEEKAEKKRAQVANAKKGSHSSLPAEVSTTDFPLKPEDLKKKFDPSHRFSLGYNTRNITSIYFVDTSTPASFLNVSAQGHFPLAVFDGKVAASYHLLYNRPVSVPMEIPDVYELGGHLTYLSSFWNLSAGLLRDTSFFVNLPSPGEGLQARTLTATYAQIKSEVTIDYKGPWVIGASYGSPMTVATNYSPLKEAKSWSGSHVMVSITPPYSYQKFNLHLQYEKTNLTTQGEIPFIFNDSRIGLSVRRSL